MRPKLQSPVLKKKRKKHQMVKVAGKLELSQVWWHKLVIPERGRWRQEDQESSDQGSGRWLRCGTSEGLRSALGSHVRKLAMWCAFRIPVLERWTQESLQGSLAIQPCPTSEPQVSERNPASQNRASGSERTGVLVTFPIAVIKHHDKGSYKRKHLVGFTVS